MQFSPMGWTNFNVFILEVSKQLFFFKGEIVINSCYLSNLRVAINAFIPPDSCNRILPNSILLYVHE